ncbi:hypothetical protein EDD18DRAFT_1330715 [Armillaria luteobubalina]|uniref:Uncharacterized protein n=1 Tax=Armillaria luteobubalina TaxID=153913 RepID=A0AA39UQ36_9AGAR|nr:hypothetical protein EDD18DRAFT_1330715 [Armillaria luteobubalina]
MVSFSITGDVDGYTSFSEYGRSNKAYASAESTGRADCLQRLTDTICFDEKSAEYLFKAFDVDVISSSPSSLLPPFADAEHEVEHRNDDFFHSSSPSSLVEHPYLSTPLRLKHFSKLSPTILRGLLRSPSLRVFTPDTSFSEECSAGYFLDPALVPSFEQSNSKEPVLYPISPPPTAKFPSTPHLPALSVFDEISTEMSRTVENPHSNDCASTLPPSPPPEERRPFLHTHHTCPGLSVSTIAQFRLVVAELGCTGKDPEKRSLLQSNLRLRLVKPTIRKEAGGKLGRTLLRQCMLMEFWKESSSTFFYNVQKERRRKQNS